MRVEDGEGGAVEEADLRVAHAEIGFDVLGQDRDDLAIEEIDDVDEHEHAEHVIRVGAAHAIGGLGGFARIGQLRLRIAAPRPRHCSRRATRCVELFARRGVASGSGGAIGVLLPPGRACIEVCELRARAGPARALRRPARAGPTPWLLDSSLPSARLGRWSFAGAEPWAILRVRADHCEIECLRAVRPGLAVGRRVLREDPLDAAARARPARSRRACPRGAAVRRRRGRLCSATSSRSSSTCTGCTARTTSAPRRGAAIHRCVLGFDHERGRAESSGSAARPIPPRARERAERAARALAPATRSGAPRAPRARGAAHTAAPVARSELDVCRIRAKPSSDRRRDRGGRASIRPASRIASIAIRRRRLGALSRAAPPQPRAVRRLSSSCRRSRSRGSSPERFLRVDAVGPRREPADQGHAPRGSDPATDARARSALLASAKDRAENLMIVDLVRNDLGRVCAPAASRCPSCSRSSHTRRCFSSSRRCGAACAPGCDALDALARRVPAGLDDRRAEARRDARCSTGSSRCGAASTRARSAISTRAAAPISRS